MATTYGGMPSGTQADLEKKKKKPVTPLPVIAPVAPVVTPLPTIDSSVPLVGAAAQADAQRGINAARSTSLNTPQAVQNQQAAIASALPPIPGANSTTLNTPIGVQDQIAAAGKDPAYIGGTPGAPAPTTPSGTSGGIPSGTSGVASDSSAPVVPLPAIIDPTKIDTGSPSAPTVAPVTPTTFTAPEAPAAVSAPAVPTTTFEMPEKEKNVYFDNVVNSKFDYNPATDQGYMKAAAGAENAIIQSIIGRGGLYSSVAQNAVAAKLTDLSIEYEQMAYQKYADTRAYNMQLAQFEQSRIDTSWNQSFQGIQFASQQQQQQYDNQFQNTQFGAQQQQQQYENNFQGIQFASQQQQQQYENYVAQEQQKFNSQMDLANFQFTQEQEAFDRNQTIQASQRASQTSYSSSSSSSAKAATAAQEADLNTRLLQNQTARNQLSSYSTQWTNNGGVATKAVADFFSAYGVQVGDSMSDFTDIISGMRNQLDADINTISAGLTDVADQKRVSQYMDDYMKDNTKPVTTPITAGSTSENSTPGMQTAYYSILNSATGSKATAKTISSQINMLSSSAGAPLRKKLGEYYYGQLMSALLSAKQRLQGSGSSSNTGSGFGTSS